MLIPDSLIKSHILNFTGIIQVGGHIGQEISIFTESFNCTDILIFEPIPSCFNQIPTSDKIIKVNCALGNKVGIVEFNIASNEQSSSILKPKTHLVEHPWVHFCGQISVPMLTLDIWMEQNKPSNVSYNFMSIDVQGYELEVLKGSRKTLESIDGILCEVNKNELYEGCSLVHEVDEYLSNYGFTRTHTQWFENCGWGDALYVKHT